MTIDEDERARATALAEDFAVQITPDAARALLARENGVFRACCWWALDALDYFTSIPGGAAKADTDQLIALGPLYRMLVEQAEAAFTAQWGRLAEAQTDERRPDVAADLGHLTPPCEVGDEPSEAASHIASTVLHHSAGLSWNSSYSIERCACGAHWYLWMWVEDPEPADYPVAWCDSEDTDEAEAKRLLLTAYWEDIREAYDQTGFDSLDADSIVQAVHEQVWPQADPAGDLLPPEATSMGEAARQMLLEKLARDELGEG